jgi:acetyl esterase/lipase/sugar lactone lactonase YvrE
MIRQTLLPSLLLLATSVIAQTTPAPVKPTGASTVLTPAQKESVTELLDQTYLTHGDKKMQLDLYRPKNIQEPLPAILCIHGGGWCKGDRKNMRTLATALAAKGYVTAAVSYRLSGEAKFPAAIHDCKAAVRWLRANAQELGIQPHAIGVTGLSAGGHLAALIATSSGVPELEGTAGNLEQPSIVQACIAMGAQSDLTAPHIRTLSAKADDPYYTPFLGGSAEKLPETYALASPRQHLNSADPPIAFMTGDQDDPSTHAEAFRQEQMKLGCHSGFTLLPKAPHSFLGQQAAFNQCVEVCDTFFHVHLRHLSSPTIDTDTTEVFEPHARWRILGSGYAGCEGAQWIDATLYYAAHHDHLAFKWSARDSLSVWRSDSPEATSFRPDGKDGYYVVEQQNRRLVRWNDKAEMTEVLADKFEGKRLNRPNDAVVRKDGSVWLTDPDFLFNQRPQDKKELTEQHIFRYDPESKKLSSMTTELKKPNGIAFSPDDHYLYATDASSDEISRWPLETNGKLGARTVFAKVAEKGLDGLAFDHKGRLWCCTQQGVRLFDEAGKCLGLVKTPLSKPTSVSFGLGHMACVTVRDACLVIQPK